MKRLLKLEIRLAKCIGNDFKRVVIVLTTKFKVGHADHIQRNQIFKEGASRANEYQFPVEKLEHS